MNYNYGFGPSTFSIAKVRESAVHTHCIGTVLYTSGTGVYKIYKEG